MSQTKVYLHKECLHTSVKVVGLFSSLQSVVVSAEAADPQVVGGLHIDGVSMLLTQRLVFL